MTMSVLTDTTMAVLMFAMMVPALAAVVATVLDVVRSPVKKTRQVRVPARASRHAVEPVQQR